jgi:hypothetical protein
MGNSEKKGNPRAFICCVLSQYMILYIAFNGVSARARVVPAYNFSKLTSNYREHSGTSAGEP